MQPSLPPPCANCFHRRRCLPSALSPHADDEVAAAFECVLRVPRSESLATQKSVETTVFVVRTGAFKSEASIHRGEVRVFAVHEPGDFMAVETLLGHKPSMERVALETSTVCAFDANKLNAMTSRRPELKCFLERLTDGALLQAEEQLLVLGSLRATERLAWFLIRMSEQRRAHGRHSTELTLPLSREDIGNHLGVRMETVCRIFNDLERRGMIARRGHQRLDILDRNRLAELAGLGVLPAPLGR